MIKIPVKFQAAFTIVELLVVIGIIAILAVALLVTLNPADAQRRARDTQRLRELNSLQAVVENFINDNRVFGTCTDALCESNVIGGAPVTTNAAQPCDNNWLEEDMCDYARTIPADPLNGQANRGCWGFDGTTYTQHNDCTFRYRFEFSNSSYEIQTLVESRQNAIKVGSDGGATTGGEEIWMQIYSGTPVITVYTDPTP